MLALHWLAGRPPPKSGRRNGLAGHADCRLGMLVVAWHGRPTAGAARIVAGASRPAAIRAARPAPGEASMGGVRRTRRRIGGVGVDLEEISLARKMNDDGG